MHKIILFLHFCNLIIHISALALFFLFFITPPLPPPHPPRPHPLPPLSCIITFLLLFTTNFSVLSVISYSSLPSHIGHHYHLSTIHYMHLSTQSNFFSLHLLFPTSNKLVFIISQYLFFKHYTHYLSHFPFLAVSLILHTH